MSGEKTLLHRHQAVLLELLAEFDRICGKYGIRYVLFAGSALGAVRHQGFIPWDDDLDVAMLRPDYERFLQVAHGELDEKLFHLQAEFTNHWPMFFSKLRKNGTACMERFVPKDEKLHQGIYMDIFPVDNLSDNSFVRKLQFVASKVVIARGLRDRGYLTDSKVKKLFMGCCALMPVRIFHSFACQKEKPTAMVHTFFGAASRYEKNVFPRGWFEQTVQLSFEGRDVPVSADYDAMLTHIYGDYRTPPTEDEKRCKVHGVIVDPDHSYEGYLQQQKQMKVTEYSRSIR